MNNLFLQNSEKLIAVERLTTTARVKDFMKIYQKILAEKKAKQATMAATDKAAALAKFQKAQFNLHYQIVRGLNFFGYLELGQTEIDDIEQELITLLRTATDFSIIKQLLIDQEHRSLLPRINSFDDVDLFGIDSGFGTEQIVQSGDWAINPRMRDLLDNYFFWLRSYSMLSSKQFEALRLDFEPAVELELSLLSDIKALSNNALARSPLNPSLIS